MLSARALTLDVDGARLLDGIDLDVAPGASLAITGDAGAGKTTLLRVLAGVIAPTAGSVHVDGTALRPHDVRLALLEQDAGQATPLPGDASTSAGARAGPDHGPAQDRYAAVAASLGLAPTVLARPLQTLSRGERTRARLARLVAASPAYLLLDDALGVLDTAALVAVTDLLARLRALGTGIVLATADDGLAARLADGALVLEDGRVRAS